MIISTNIHALTSLNRLNNVDRKTNNTFQKLSSGLRINKAADDGTHQGKYYTTSCNSTVSPS